MATHIRYCPRREMREMWKSCFLVGTCIMKMLYLRKHTLCTCHRKLNETDKSTETW